MNWLNAFANVGLGVAAAVAQKQINQEASKKARSMSGVPAKEPCKPCQARAYAAEQFPSNHPDEPAPRRRR